MVSPTGPSNINFKVELLRQFDFEASKPARLHIQLSNTGKTPLHYEYGYDEPITEYVGYHTEQDARLFLAPESGTGELTMSADDIAPERTLHTDLDEIDSLRTRAEVLPDDRLKLVLRGIDIAPGKSVGQSYQLYLFEENNPPLPPGGYQFSGGHRIQRGSAQRMMWGQGEMRDPVHVTFSFSLTASDDGSLSLTLVQGESP